MAENSLAAASVPVQQWGELYEDSEAFCTGTIFRDLDKPFFAAEEKTCRCAERMDVSGLTPTEVQKEELLCKISRTGFVLDDLTLYLDTHENDRQAMAMYLQKLREKKEYMEEFAGKYYPLTKNCILAVQEEASDMFPWVKGPKPWEGGVF